MLCSEDSGGATLPGVWPSSGWGLSPGSRIPRLCVTLTRSCCILGPEVNMGAFTQAKRGHEEEGRQGGDLPSVTLVTVGPVP